MRAAWRFLRSRRLAIWAIVAFTAYAAIATVVSGTGDFAAPYGNPIFIVISALLALSTAACAWERTRTAVRTLTRKAPPEAALRHLRENPPISVSVPTASEPLAVAQAVLRRLGMRVRLHDASLEARAGLAGSFGSPLFHWALALLFVVIGLGQLTRSEGLMGVVEGSAKPDVAESYGTLDAGPLKAELSGRTIAVPVVEQSYVANGIEQGVTPLVEIRSADGELLASGHAYPNHPIRYRSMLVHSNDYGLAVVASIEQAGVVLSEEVLLDYNADRSAVEPNGFSIADETGSPLLSLWFDLPAERNDDVRSVSVKVVRGSASPNGEAAEVHAVNEGGTLDLGDGMMLRVDRLTGYARLSVVDDWSVYYIYALFALAMIGLVLAVFAPPRAVRVLLAAESGGQELHVAVRHGRGDPHFSGRVECALRAAFESEETR